VRMDDWVRRGRDDLHVMIVAAVNAAHGAEALDLAWQSFMSAAGDNPVGNTVAVGCQLDAVRVR